MKTQRDELIPTRVSLLNRLRDYADGASWQEFFSTYRPLVHSVAARSGLSDAEAQEAVQETFIAVAKKMENFRYDPAVDSFKGWLFYLTRKSVALQFRRRERNGRRGRSSGESSSAPADPEALSDVSTVDPEAIWEEEWERHLLQVALARVKGQVNARHYQMFDLYVGKQWPVRQVAEAMGVTSAQVYLAKHRIVTLVRQEVARLGREGL